MFAVGFCIAWLCLYIYLSYYLQSIPLEMFFFFNRIQRLMARLSICPLPRCGLIPCYRPKVRPKFQIYTRPKRRKTKTTTATEETPPSNRTLPFHLYFTGITQPQTGYGCSEDRYPSPQKHVSSSFQAYLRSQPTLLSKSQEQILIFLRTIRLADHSSEMPRESISPASFIAISQTALLA